MNLRVIVSSVLSFVCFYVLPTFGASPSPTALSEEDIPGLSLLVETVKSMPIYQDEKTQILAAVLPSSKRPYYKMNQDFLDPTTREGLIKTYSGILGVPESQITLFAVSNPSLQRTVLFPEFFALKSPIAQAALLFHEALWLMGAQDYKKVVLAEAALQKYLVHPEDREVYYDFYNQLSSFFTYPNLKSNVSVVDTEPSKADIIRHHIRRMIHILLPATLEYDRNYNPSMFTDARRTRVLLKNIFGSKYLTGWAYKRDQQNVIVSSLMLYTLSCCSSGEAGIQSSLFMRAFGIYVNTLDFGQLLWNDTLPFPALKTPEQISSFVDGLELNIQAIMASSYTNFAVYWNGRMAGQYVLEVYFPTNLDSIVCPGDDAHTRLSPPTTD